MRLAVKIFWLFYIIGLVLYPIASTLSDGIEFWHPDGHLIGDIDRVRCDSLRWGVYFSCYSTHRYPGTPRPTVDLGMGEWIGNECALLILYGRNNITAWIKLEHYSWK